MYWTFSKVYKIYQQWIPNSLFRIDISLKRYVIYVYDRNMGTTIAIDLHATVK